MENWISSFTIVYYVGGEPDDTKQDIRSENLLRAIMQQNDEQSSTDYNYYFLIQFLHYCCKRDISRTVDLK